MTQAQLDAITAATAALNAADTENMAAQKAAADADAAYQAALNFANSILPQQQATERANAANAVQAAMQARTDAFNKSGAAAAAVNQAVINVQNAALQSQNNGAVEDVSHTSKPMTF